MHFFVVEVPTWVVMPTIFDFPATNHLFTIDL